MILPTRRFAPPQEASAAWHSSMEHTEQTADRQGVAVSANDAERAAVPGAVAGGRDDLGPGGAPRPTQEGHGIQCFWAKSRATGSVCVVVEMEEEVEEEEMEEEGGGTRCAVPHKEPSVRGEEEDRVRLAEEKEMRERLLRERLLRDLTLQRNQTNVQVQGQGASGETGEASTSSAILHAPPTPTHTSVQSGFDMDPPMTPLPETVTYHGPSPTPPQSLTPLTKTVSYPLSNPPQPGMDMLTPMTKTVTYDGGPEANMMPPPAHRPRNHATSTSRVKQKVVVVQGHDGKGIRQIQKVPITGKMLQAHIEAKALAVSNPTSVTAHTVFVVDHSGRWQ